MIVMTPDPLTTTDEVVIEYVNHLRRQHAIDQAMLASPHDEARLKHLGEVRAKNTKLESDNRELRALNQELRDRIAVLAAVGEYAAKAAAKAVAPSTWDINQYCAEAEHWCRDTFGDDVTNNKCERSARVGEEAIELMQACGVGRAFAHHLVNYVYDRPAGGVQEELNGVAMTWAVFQAQMTLAPQRALQSVLDACWARQDQILKKSEQKFDAGVAFREPVKHIKRLEPDDKAVGLT